MDIRHMVHACMRFASISTMSVLNSIRIFLVATDQDSKQSIHKNN